MFALHPRLNADCIVLGQFALCQVLLLNDARFPWFILVPMRDDITEIYELDHTDQQQLVRESAAFGQAIMDYYDGDKLNIGALGNMVPQLHIHHIVRKIDDAAWPGAVWGSGEGVPYMPQAIVLLKSELRNLGLVGFTPAAD